MKKSQFHEALKNFLIDIGDREGFKSSSGDSDFLEFRSRGKRVEYRPDVLWRGESCYAFELAFTEELIDVIGQYAHASLGGCSRFFVFRLAQTEEEKKSERERLKNIFETRCKKYGVTVWYIWVLTEDQTEDIERTKKEVRRELKRLKFIK